MSLHKECYERKRARRRRRGREGKGREVEEKGRERTRTRSNRMRKGRRWRGELERLVHTYSKNVDWNFQLGRCYGRR